MLMRPCRPYSFEKGVRALNNCIVLQRQIRRLEDELRSNSIEPTVQASLRRELTMRRRHLVRDWERSNYLDPDGTLRNLGP